MLQRLAMRLEQVQSVAFIDRWTVVKIGNEYYFRVKRLGRLIFQWIQPIHEFYLLLCGRLTENFGIYLLEVLIVHYIDHWMVGIAGKKSH